MSELIHDETTLKADLLSAMSNPKRLQILQILSLCDMPVGVLAGKVGLSQSALSQHLAKLRMSGLVRTRRYANHIYYSGCSEAVHIILDTLSRIYPAATSDEVKPAFPNFHGSSFVH